MFPSDLVRLHLCQHGAWIKTKCQSSWWMWKWSNNMLQKCKNKKNAIRYFTLLKWLERYPFALRLRTETTAECAWPLNFNCSVSTPPPCAAAELRWGWEQTVVQLQRRCHWPGSLPRVCPATTKLWPAVGSTMPPHRLIQGKWRDVWRDTVETA